MVAATQQGGGRPLPIALLDQANRRLSRHDLEALNERLLIELDRLLPEGR